MYSLYIKYSYWKFASLNYLHMSDLTIYHFAFYLLSKLIYDNYIMTSEKRSTPFLFCQSSTFLISESYHLFSFDNNKQIFRLYSSACQWRNANNYINRKRSYNLKHNVFKIEFRHTSYWPTTWFHKSEQCKKWQFSLAYTNNLLFCKLLNVHLWVMHGRISSFYLM